MSTDTITNKLYDLDLPDTNVMTLESYGADNSTNNVTNILVITTKWPTWKAKKQNFSNYELF
jgi:hypothetical protein